MNPNFTHRTVISHPKDYYGWPANHGAWQWGDEILVSYACGKFAPGARMHAVVGPLLKYQSRSLDGGSTWDHEVPNVDFEGVDPTSPPKFDVKDVILRFCGFYDHGGEACDSNGAFYLSRNKGKHWTGPFWLRGIQTLFDDPYRCTTRTCVLDDLVFLSRARRCKWGTDEVLCTRWTGEKFELVSHLPLSSTLPQVNIVEKGWIPDRMVMPAVARLGNEIHVVCRRRRGAYCWIDHCFSVNGGNSWSDPTHVADTGTSNGNPPALANLDGKLFCAYANRTKRSIDLRWLTGWGWSSPISIRLGDCRDIGYPRLFPLSDGRLICIYYWSDNGTDPQRIEATEITGVV